MKPSSPPVGTLLFPDLPVRSVQDMGIKELERVRLILRGGSVIEWRQLHFKEREEVDRFLRLSQIEPQNPHDEAWARQVLADSVEYLRRTFNYKVAEQVANPKELHDLFLFASGVKTPKKYRKIACVVLKVMHVLQHLEARDLLFHIGVSEAELNRLVTSRVMAVAHEMKEKLPVVEFADSIKARESIITKLLAKKETVAAQVYDRTRFRIITETRADILPVLYFLTQRLFPFNIAVPRQTENTLLPFKELLREFPHLEKYAHQLHLDLDFEDREAQGPGNVFSGKGYRILNFVVNVPIRMDAYLPPPELDSRPNKGRVVFAQVEFQIVDKETALLNETGENSHAEYKRRQKMRVLRRLSRGLVVPRNAPRKTDW